MIVTFPWDIRTRFTTGMGDLNTRHRTGRLDRRGDFSQLFSLRIIPDAKAVRCNATFWRNTSSLNNNKPAATTRQTGVMNSVPVIGHALLRHVLAHRWNSNAVL